jgi:WD40 repeat protein
MPTIAPHDFGEHCLFAGFINETAFFATVDGAVHRLGGHRQTLPVHQGLCSVAKAPSGALITGGEDGKVARIRADGSIETINEAGRKWITQLACGPKDTIAWATGKDVTVRFDNGSLNTLSHQRTIEGLAFFPKGIRLAAAHYDAVTLHFPTEKNAVPQHLGWKGAHLGVTVSPDGAYVVTSMQENALHGWRLADKRDMRMSGYPAKTKSLSWSAKGKYLATSGAPAAIVWPFLAKDGPMGKAPLELGTRGDTMVTEVACHPAEDLVAIGYGDGMVLLVRFSDAREVLLRRQAASAASAITSLGWDQFGARLAYGSQNGDCGVIDLRG